MTLWKSAWMTSAQACDEVGSTIEPTSSMPIFKWLYLVIYETLALALSVLLNELLELSLCKIPGWSRHVFLAIDEVWIDRVCVRYDWWRRLQPTSIMSPLCSVADWVTRIIIVEWKEITRNISSLSSSKFHCNMCTSTSCMHSPLALLRKGIN